MMNGILKGIIGPGAMIWGTLKRHLEGHPWPRCDDNCMANGILKGILGPGAMIWGILKGILKGILGPGAMIGAP